MSYFLINGGRRLSGELTVHGAKNSVLPILAATLLVKGHSVIENCPDLHDVSCTVAILRHLGCKVERQGGAIAVDASTLTRTDIPDALMREMRSSIVFLGAILGRCGVADMSEPGGCELGLRPIDLHLSALRQLGALITTEGGRLHCVAGALTGSDVTLAFPSVGATENLLLAACCATGRTTLRNAACEPEIVDLCHFLAAAGVGVRGAGTPTITVEGAVTQSTVRHGIIADRIVAATYMAAVASAGGSVALKGVDREAVATAIDVLARAGCEVSNDGALLVVTRHKRLTAAPTVRTMPYPGFPTDAQPPVMAALATAAGTTLFIETMFENRYRHVAELVRMGATIKVDGRAAVVCGVEKLHGCSVQSADLRGGAALTVAALGAEGTTRVSNLHYVDRGYDALETALASVGADITRVID